MNPRISDVRVQVFLSIIWVYVAGHEFLTKVGNRHNIGDVTEWSYGFQRSSCSGSLVYGVPNVNSPLWVCTLLKLHVHVRQISIAYAVVLYPVLVLVRQQRVHIRSHRTAIYIAAHFNVCTHYTGCRVEAQTPQGGCPFRRPFRPPQCGSPETGLFWRYLCSEAA